MTRRALFHYVDRRPQGDLSKGSAVGRKKNTITWTCLWPAQLEGAPIKSPGATVAKIGGDGQTGGQAGGGIVRQTDRQRDGRWGKQGFSVLLWALRELQFTQWVCLRDPKNLIIIGGSWWSCKQQTLMNAALYTITAVMWLWIWLTLSAFPLILWCLRVCVSIIVELMRSSHGVQQQKAEASLLMSLYSERNPRNGCAASKTRCHGVSKALESNQQPSLDRSHRHLS